MWSLDEEGFIEVPVYNGPQLPVDQELSGPAIVELGTSTLVVHQRYAFRVSPAGSYIVTSTDTAPSSRSRGGLQEVST
jgi:N-methylhydantoinase A